VPRSAGKIGPLASRLLKVTQGHIDPGAYMRWPIAPPPRRNLFISVTDHSAKFGLSAALRPLFNRMY